MNSTPQSTSLPHFRAVIEYDGTDFLGFQFQASGRTVQGEIEQTLLRLTQQSTRVVGAGRTDAGVHAFGQVISFRSVWKHPPSDLRRALNALLPIDIAVRFLDLAPADFHPRFSATERWYRYQVGQWSIHSPLRTRYAWELPPAVDLEAMNRAAAHLIGSHDFAAFGQPPQDDPTASTIRLVNEARWWHQTPYLFFDIRANAFLRRMVRIIVGTLVQVGLGRMVPTQVADMLASRDRSLVAQPAPPQGLILMSVTYPGSLEFPSISGLSGAEYSAEEHTSGAEYSAKEFIL